MLVVDVDQCFMTKDRAKNKCLTSIVRSTRRAGSRQLRSDIFFRSLQKDFTMLMKTWMTCVVLLTLLLSSLPSASAEDPWQADPALVAKLSVSKQQFNYDEAKVPEYTLPNPLLTNSGTVVTDAAHWPARRAETMELFRAHVYGRRPQTPYQISFTTTAEQHGLFDIDATGRAISVTIRVGTDAFSFPVYVFVPPPTNGPGPAVIHINNREFPTFEAAATVDDEFWPVREILKRGYVACAVSTVTIDPDVANGFDKGIRGFFHRAGGDSVKPPADDAWKALSAWGWGASRALDYLLTLDQVDPAEIAVIGHSRGGKASLWAAAEDPRFATACSNNSGCGGAALSRRMYGETIGRITTAFPHWFCDRFATYAGQESTLPIDQHQLFGLIAPRPVYATSAADDLWADPRGEYLSLVAATPVYQMLGKQGIQNNQMPSLGVPRVEGQIGYHIRAGAHGLTGYDWQKFLDFCDSQ